MLLFLCDSVECLLLQTSVMGVWLVHFQWPFMAILVFRLCSFLNLILGMTSRF